MDLRLAIGRWILGPLLTVGVVVGSTETASAQESTARVTVEENFRAEPQGAILGRLQPGIVLRVISEDGSWVQVAVEGWMWTPSLLATSRLGFDLQVGVDQGENLRAEPQGSLLARLWRGTLLERLEEIEGWHRVRRVGWVWGPSLALSTERPTGRPTTGAEEPVGQVEGWVPSPAQGASILSGPDGDTLGRTRPGTELEVLSRQGNWARVRLEGWIWDPMGEEAPESPRPSARTDATPAEVARNPDAFRGRIVSWDLQFVSLERAERVRTDFYEGEPFLLARSVSGGTFVYVAVPPERLSEVEGLIPLERIRVVGRVRTGAAALTGNPILDLMDLQRTGRDRL